MELEKQALMKKTRVSAKTTVKASTKAAVKVCNKQLKFTKSPADPEINQGKVCAIIFAFRSKRRNEV